MTLSPPEPQLWEVANRKKKSTLFFSRRYIQLSDHRKWLILVLFGKKEFSLVFSLSPPPEFSFPGTGSRYFSPIIFDIKFFRLSWDFLWLIGPLFSFKYSSALEGFTQAERGVLDWENEHGWAVIERCRSWDSLAGEESMSLARGVCGKKKKNFFFLSAGMRRRCQT